MRNIILILLFSFVIKAFAQVELKGFKLGQKTLDTGISTTVGGINGNLIFNKLKDGRIFRIMFYSREADRERKINSNDIEIFKKSIENNYKIKLKVLSNKNTFGDVKNQIGYGFYFKINNDRQINLVFTLTNLDLEKLSIEEKLSNDF